MKHQSKQYDFSAMIECLRDVFDYLQKLRTRTPIATDIQNPKIPSSFAENLVKFLVETGEIPLDREICSIKLNRKRADLIATDSMQQEIKIEVKATGRNNFQGFSSKDTQADYLIWVDFGTLFENRNLSTIDVYVIQPKLDNLQPQRIDFRRLERILQKQTLQKTTLDLAKFGFC